MFFSRSKSKHSVRQFPQWLEVCLQLLPELFGQVAVMLSLREANIGLPTYALDAACLTWLQTHTAPADTQSGNRQLRSLPRNVRRRAAPWRREAALGQSFNAPAAGR